MTCYISRLIVLALITLSCLSAHARIGESRRTIENRLTQGGRGLVIDDDDLRHYYIRQAPFTALIMERVGGEFAIHPELNLSVGVYYKTIGDERAFKSRLTQDNGRPVEHPAGWMLYVVYYKGQSVLEYYARSGSMTEAESNGILLLNQGSSNWVNDKLPEEKYPNDDYEPLLPHKFHRADGKLLANLESNGLMIFQIEVDAMLSQAKHKRESEDAPDSLAGF